MNRKVELDTFRYNEKTGDHTGGDSHCDHDYPPESKEETAHGVYWRCSKCHTILSFDRR